MTTKAKGYATIEGFLIPRSFSSPSRPVRVVPASNFMATVAANVDNGKMSDAEFRKFVRDTLPIVQYDGAK